MAILVMAVLYLRPAGPVTQQLAPQRSGAFTLDPAYEAVYDFVSPTMGWAALARAEPGRVAYWIFATADEARHWKVQVTGLIGGSESLVELRFFDRLHGYAVIGRQLVLATSSGGARWGVVVHPTRFAVDVTFSDPLDGWLMGTDDLFGGKGGPYPLYMTHDGGKGWNQAQPPPGGGFAFRSASEGWAAAATEMGGTVYTSHDGGFTWVPHRLPEGTPAEGKGGDTQVRLLPGRGVLATVGTFVFSSFDAGESWRQISLPPEVVLSDIAFQDETHWWVMPSGNLFKTSDAGQTWQHVSLQFDDWQYRVQVVDKGHAWARLDLSIGTQDPTRGTALAVTKDGGLHWDYANVPRPVNPPQPA